MRIRDRRGFTMIELMIALILVVIMAGGLYGVLTSVQRVSRRQTQMSNMQGNLRGGIQLIQSELQEIATNSGTGDTDILSGLANPNSSIRYRAMRGLGEICAITASEVRIHQNSYAGRGPIPTRDGLAIYVDNDTTKITDDEWVLEPAITGVAGSTCPDGSLAWAIGVSLDAGDVAGVWVPSPVRTWEEMEIGRVTDASQEWLGIRSVSGNEAALVPVIGPVTASGVEFRYFETGGAATTTASAVKLIEVTLRGISATNVNTGMDGTIGSITDSLVVRVQLRNSL